MIARPLALSTDSNQAWATPAWLFALLDKRFSFALDAAASHDNAKCKLYYTEAEDGITSPWYHTTFCNPPWADPAPWCSKARTEAVAGVRSALLLPQLGLTTAWYRDVRKDCRTEILSPRIAYDGTKTSPPGGSMLLVFGDGGEGQVTFWDVMRFRPGRAA
jgi:site-specific DNA-methyltransferase (adenine-specific)